MRSSDLISVIVPAFNAERYIGPCLQSVVGQSHKNIEIIVVDDGSTDRTAEIAATFASRDGRVRLIQQENRGVAAARNMGVRAASGSYIAPLDADDLWDSRKLEKQLAVFQGSTADLGLVYSLYREIDEDDCVLTSLMRRRPTGWVFLQHANENFIGCGSSILVRRNAVEVVGGYSTQLRRAGAEGCEDMFLQLCIAANYRFDVVPEYLVGYRRVTGSMSSSFLKMASSRKLVIESFFRRCSPPAELALLHALYRCDFHNIRLGLRYGSYGTVGRSLLDIARRSPTLVPQLSRELFQMFVRRIGDRRSAKRTQNLPPIPRRSFWDFSVTDGLQTETTPRSDGFMADLKALDQDLGPKGGYLIGSIEKGSLAIGGNLNPVLGSHPGREFGTDAKGIM